MNYNGTGRPKVLEGNYVEERALLAETGIARRRRAPGAAAAADESIYPRPEERAANAAQPETFPRVIPHAGAPEPAAWASAARAAFAPPDALRAGAAGAFQPGARAPGPREAAELRMLRERAAAEAAAEAAARDTAAAAGVAASQFGTTAGAEFRAPPLEGLELGARVMRTPDGGPVRRDVEFVVEAGILPRGAADRILRRQDAFRYREGSPVAALAEARAADASPARAAADAPPSPAASAAAAAIAKLGLRSPRGGGPGGGGSAGRSPRGVSALGTASPRGAPASRADQAEPVTLYNFEAPDSPRAGGAAGSGGGSPAGGRKAAALAATGLTAGPKSRPMARNDRFTKLAGDVNQRGDDG
ncbi:hypothetical protein Rsub_02531 [Raphidocelis subcapitata]|uniref:Uncharacterized protein n=1 Tax=Raphidocelis subcapitata TaxID=307507 RepID=A0A2V0NY23_9CHLO|nr:hypothetical protein Rsub_02531 [Raphidocelis subcapitata]|eukprot:GBF89827.1 hypothetical protein Rsub_02531 [Raphidocelis subcapitata]